MDKKTAKKSTSRKPKATKQDIEEDPSDDTFDSMSDYTTVVPTKGVEEFGESLKAGSSGDDEEPDESETSKAKAPRKKKTDEAKPKPAARKKKTDGEVPKPPSKAVGEGFRYMYFICKKGSTEKNLEMKVGVSNNVADDRAKMQEHSRDDLKCHAIVECPSNDAVELYERFQQFYSEQFEGRGWFRLSKEMVDREVNRWTSGGSYVLTTEGKAKVKKSKSKATDS